MDEIERGCVRRRTAFGCVCARRRGNGRLLNCHKFWESVKRIRNFGKGQGLVVREFVACGLLAGRALHTNTLPFPTNFRKACNEKYTRGANNRALSGVHHIGGKARDVLDALRDGILTGRKEALQVYGNLQRPCESFCSAGSG